MEKRLQSRSFVRAPRAAQASPAGKGCAADAKALTVLGIRVAEAVGFVLPVRLGLYVIYVMIQSCTNSQIARVEYLCYLTSGCCAFALCDS